MAAWSRQLGTYGVWLALGALLVAALLTAPEFFGVANLQDVLRRASILGIVTMGQVLVLLTAGLDLSVGAMIGMTAVLIAESARSDGPPFPVAMGAAVAVAVVVGLVNGLLVARRRVPPFVATFGMLIVLEGLRLAYTGGTASGNVPEALREIGQATLVGIPWPTLAPDSTPSYSGRSSCAWLTSPTYPNKCAAMSRAGYLRVGTLSGMIPGSSYLRAWTAMTCSRVAFSISTIGR